MEIFDEVIFCFDDEAGVEYKASFIHYEDSFWLVATWWKPLTGGERIPDRIIPLQSFQPDWLGQVTPMYRLQKPIPRILFSQDAPPELLSTWSVQTFPSVAHTQGPSSTH